MDVHIFGDIRLYSFPFRATSSPSASLKIENYQGAFSRYTNVRRSSSWSINKTSSDGILFIRLEMRQNMVLVFIAYCWIDVPSRVCSRTTIQPEMSNRRNGFRFAKRRDDVELLLKRFFINNTFSLVIIFSHLIKLYSLVLCLLNL